MNSRGSSVKEIRELARQDHGAQFRGTEIGDEVERVAIERLLPDCFARQ